MFIPSQCEKRSLIGIRNTYTDNDAFKKWIY